MARGPGAWCARNRAYIRAPLGPQPYSSWPGWSLAPGKLFVPKPKPPGAAKSPISSRKYYEGVGPSVAQGRTRRCSGKSWTRPPTALAKNWKASIREKRLPDDWLTFSARNALGENLMAHKQYAEAEALLISGYDGPQNARAKSIPQNRQVTSSETRLSIAEAQAFTLNLGELNLRVSLASRSSAF